MRLSWQRRHDRRVEYHTTFITCATCHRYRHIVQVTASFTKVVVEEHAMLSRVDTKQRYSLSGYDIRNHAFGRCKVSLFVLNTDAQGAHGSCIREFT